MAQQTDGGSFRDPAGTVIYRQNRLLRIIAPCYVDTYNLLVESGLYHNLTGRGLLVQHTELEAGSTIAPEIIPLVTYSYEWPFRHLQAAAATTLDCAITALDYDMILKDASSFNIQYHHTWKLIDTLSFTPYKIGTPWVAYTQFLRHFLYPLLLRKYHIPYPYWQKLDGVPSLDAAHLLPKRLMLNPRLAPHIYLLARHGDPSTDGWSPKMPKRNLAAFLRYLLTTVRSLQHTVSQGWIQYKSCSYTSAAGRVKRTIVSDLLTTIINTRSKTRLLDVGANTGEYTRLARDLGFSVVALDYDHDCADSIAPLSLHADICNPSPPIGWSGRERKGLLNRLEEYNRDGVVLALALVHHLCIGNNTPIGMVLDLFAQLGKQLIVEFVPPDDPKAEIIGRGREFPEYHKDIFVSELKKRYTVCAEIPIPSSVRIIYHAVRKGK